MRPMALARAKALDEWAAPGNRVGAGRSRSPRPDSRRGGLVTMLTTVPRELATS